MAATILTLLYNGVADWEVGFPWFCLKPKIESRFASPGQPRVKTALGFETPVSLTDLANIDAGEFDAVYLPGGTDPETGRFPRGLGENLDLLRLLQEFARKDKVVAAICGAPLILGAAGLLKGRRFACDIAKDTRGWLDGAERVEGPICADGKILTASVSAIIPFCCDLARMVGEDETARDIEAFFVR